MQATTEVPVFRRELQIGAAPETVWAFLVDPTKMARWMGLPGATFEPRPGAGFRIEVVPGHRARGAVVEVDPPRLLVYTWGWEPGPDGVPAPVPPGGSTVEFVLEPAGGGTLLRLTHRDLPTREAAESHGGGWSHYLPRLAVAAAGGDPGPDPWLES